MSRLRFKISMSLDGFVGVFGKVPPEEPDQEQADYAYVSDLLVLPAHRSWGFMDYLQMAKRLDG